MSQPAPRFDRQELIPAIVQDADTRQVLMTAFMNRHKGATSGHLLNVRGVRLDCDGDAILLLVAPTGPACHTNATSCFFEEVRALPDGPTASETARELWDVITRRFAERPEGSYVSRLAEGGIDRIAKKIGEEATEVVIAAEAIWAELAKRRK
jgi:phosphoribosyl-AMP cyclohydrolase / phosphoribosyl-ATP pyrophosphohydrolase